MISSCIVGRDQGLQLIIKHLIISCLMLPVIDQLSHLGGMMEQVISQGDINLKVNMKREWNNLKMNIIIFKVVEEIRVH